MCAHLPIPNDIPMPALNISTVFNSDLISSSVLEYKFKSSIYIIPDGL